MLEVAMVGGASATMALCSTPSSCRLTTAAPSTSGTSSTSSWGGRRRSLRVSSPPSSSNTSSCHPRLSVRAEAAPAKKAVGGVGVGAASARPTEVDGKAASGGLLALLAAKFKPVQSRAEKNLPLPFEKPLVELDERIADVLRMAEENGVDVSDSINQLRERAMQLRRDTYNRLTPMERLQVARHAQRPTFLDIVLNITDKFVELHGDRGGYDDPALVTGLGTIDGKTYMFMGHQKGRNTKENIQRNFGMPTPNGYRKALRMMKHAEHHGFPIFTFIDTPGAYAGLSAEELGQGEAIANNLHTMFGVKVPIISTVIGEGGSGGALAIGICDKMLCMEHAVYYVASPEACAAILWKDSKKSPEATQALRITGENLMSLDIVDAIIPEPLGAAHANPLQACDYVKQALMREMNVLLEKSPAELMKIRHDKFRKVGKYIDPDQQRLDAEVQMRIGASTEEVLHGGNNIPKRGALEPTIVSAGAE
eukprot:jgi/Chlat1/2496/Chrsp175S02369